MAAAHARGIRILVELVVNHTSDQHPWFQRARRAPPGSPERAYYVWSDTDERYRDARIIFTDTEKSNWTWDPEAKQYYWHRFFSHQPDLNFENPAVLQEMLDVARLLGASWGSTPSGSTPSRTSSRRTGRAARTSPARTTILKQLRRFVDERFPGRMLLAEANQWPDDVRHYFGAGDECHMAFHFPLMPRIFMALRLEDVEPIVEIMRRTPPIPEPLPVGALPAQPRRADARDGDDRRAGLHVPRLLAGPAHEAQRRDPAAARAARWTTRGAGWSCSTRSSSRSPARRSSTTATRLGWATTSTSTTGTACGRRCSGARTGTPGFSRADPARLFSAPISDPVYGYQAVNVEGQLRDPSSLLHWMRNTIALRKLFKAFGRGTMEFLPVANRKVLAYVRRHEEDVLLCVANVSRFAQPAELDLVAVRGGGPGRDPRLHRVPADRDAALLPHPRAVRLLLVRAAGSRRERRRLSSRAWRPPRARPEPRPRVPRPARRLGGGALARGRLGLPGEPREHLRPRGPRLDRPLDRVLPDAREVPLVPGPAVAALRRVWLVVVMGTYGIGFLRALLVAIALAFLSWIVSELFGVRTFRSE